MKTYLVAITIFTLFSNTIWAKITPEINLIVGYSDQDRWIGKNGMPLKNSIGFEYFEKFSDDYGDFLTANFQLRLSYDSKKDSSDAWAIEIHNAWLEYKLALGKTLRFGHFDPVFGLEPLLDTHATLMQSLALKNIGFKKDWGVGYRSSYKNFDYQIAVGLGSGMGIRHKDDNYLITSRVGSKFNDFQYGISFLTGQVLEPESASTIPVASLKSDNAKAKERVGLDAQYNRGPWVFLSEIVYGQDDDVQVGGVWFQTEYTPPKSQQIKIEMQAQLWDDSSRNDELDVTLGIGASYKISSTWTIRAGYFHDINRVDGREDKRGVIQFYYLAI